MRNADDICMQAIERSINCAVPWYLMASYLYYIEDKSLLSDELYDLLCTKLKDNFASINHRHKHLLDLDALKAGSGYQIPEDKYPLICKSAAVRLYGNLRCP